MKFTLHQESVPKPHSFLHETRDQNQCGFGTDSRFRFPDSPFGFAKNESVTGAQDAQGIIEWCVIVGMERIGKVNDLTLKEYVARLEKIKGSVANHASSGNRDYYEFIRNFMP